MAEQQKSDADKDRPLSTPYGPHYGQVDETAGGADSSPFETAPTGEQADAAEEVKEQLPDGKRMEQ